VEAPRTRYAKTVDGVNIAYQVRGGGPVDLIRVMGFVGNFEIELEEPHTAEYFDGLASFSRLILFDTRGTGLSDRTQTPDLEKRAEDLRAVLDAVGSDRAVILGDVSGGALAVFFAATYPARVQALILGGAYARHAWAPDYPIGQTETSYLADREDIERRWGTIGLAQEMIDAQIPSLAEDTGFVERFARYLRHGASPSSALAFLDSLYAIDVRALLGSVQAPTLVLAIPGSGDLVKGSGDVVRERYLAERIPGARYVELPGRDFAIESTNPKALLGEMERFIRSVTAEEASFDRVLATVLFIDIVGSTRKAAQLGDAAWKELLERHHETVRALLGRYRGTEIDTAGDGFFATFDGPARGVRCARSVIDALRPLGLEVRAGLHTGEVETIDGKVGGIGVHIGARVGALAEASQVLVSSTVKDLVAGSGLAFEDAGEHELKGVPERWHLYRALHEDI
jgi:class 3 adenylate cyclase